MAFEIYRTDYALTESGWLFNPEPYLGRSLQERCSSCSTTYGDARQFALARGKSEEYCFFKCHLTGCVAVSCMECMEGLMRLAMSTGFNVFCWRCLGTLCTASVYKQFRRYDPTSFPGWPGYGTEFCDATPAMVKRATKRVSKYAQISKLENGPDDPFFERRTQFVQWYRDWYRQPRDRPWLHDGDVTAEDAWDMFWATFFGQPYSLSPAPASDSDIINRIDQLALQLTNYHVCIYLRGVLCQHDPATCTCGLCIVNRSADIDPVRPAPAFLEELEHEEEVEQGDEREPRRWREFNSYGRNVVPVARARVRSL